MKTILLLGIFLIECFGYEFVINKTEVFKTEVKSSLIRDNTNEIVVDKKTNLMWQDNSKAASVKLTWDKSVEYCNNLRLGGYDDWYLPTIDELETLSDYSAYNPAIIKGFQYLKPTFYWSSSTYVGDEQYAWSITYMYGRANHLSSKFVKRAHDKRLVRCVRLR